MNIKWLVLTGSLTLCASAANAAIVYSTAVIAPSPTPFSTSFSVELFNSSLGTLNSVTLTLESNIVGRIEVFNNTNTAQGFTHAFAAIPLTVTSSLPDATSVTALATAVLASGTATPAHAISSFSGIAASASNLVSVLPASFASYMGVGGGSALFTVASPGGSYGGTSVPGLFFGGSAVADGKFTITYDYTATSPVPVPASALLLGSGLLSLGAAWRRRRS